MPIFYFYCLNCKKEVRKLLQPEQVENPPACKCGGQLFRKPKNDTTSTVKETLDNGAMARRVERIADAERIYHERAHEDPREK